MLLILTRACNAAVTTHRQVPLGEVTGVVEAVARRRSWDWELRRKHFQEDDLFRCGETRSYSHILINAHANESVHTCLLTRLVISSCRKENEEARANGKPIKFMYRHLYCPEKGMFCSLPESTVNITGKYCEVRT